MSPVAVLDSFKDDGPVRSVINLPTPPLTGISGGQATGLSFGKEATLDRISGVTADVSEYIDTPPRRPSPWHDLAHSLSTTSLQKQTSSPLSSIPTTSPPTPSQSPILSTSQALREWESRLANPTSVYSRQSLIPPYNESEMESPALVPKLVPESDKEGHIEYKLKLINPSPERFERLVTQMLWRLKQGKSEALYELGLAGESPSYLIIIMIFRSLAVCLRQSIVGMLTSDDGTVIGLSRADMDASLRTLELMAGEVGATVLILKEIVLTTPTPSAALVDWNTPPSLRNNASVGWVLPRCPDPKARPSRETPKIKEKKKGWDKGSRRRERRTKWANGLNEVEDQQTYQRDREKPIIFDMSDITSDSDDSEVTSEWGQSQVCGDDDFDEDVPPFQLEMDDDHVSATVCSTVEIQKKGHWRRRRGDKRELGFRVDTLTGAQREERDRKSMAKATKSNARREARRLDLLRGDGMNTLMSDDAPPADDINDSSSSSALSTRSTIRSSSLRLVAPCSSVTSPTQSSARGEDTLIQDLLLTPLDNLSLSFADVRTIRPSSPSSSSSSTEYAPTWVSADTPEYVVTGNEKICVEALVVRKTAWDDAAGWGWGGDDDGWGLSAEGDESVEDERAWLEMPRSAVTASVMDGAKEWVQEQDEGSDSWGF